MSDEKDISSQIHEYHVLINDLKNENINLPEAFIFGALIEKLPDSWKDYKKELKYKRKHMKCEYVIIFIRIEEKNKKREKTERAKELASKANLIESKPSKLKKYFHKPNFKLNQNPEMKKILTLLSRRKKIVFV